VPKLQPLPSNDNIQLWNLPKMKPTEPKDYDKLREKFLLQQKKYDKKHPNGFVVPTKSKSHPSR
jgi:hypothetical protein